MSRCRAFTLIELLVVAGIMALPIAGLDVVLGSGNQSPYIDTKPSAQELSSPAPNVKY